MLTLSRHQGTGGVIKQAPEDFVVKEITSKGKVLQPNTKYSASSLGLEEKRDGKHICFVLQKRDWNTVDALIAIAKKLGHGRKSIGYAGSKDKKAISVQLASVFHPSEFDLSTIQISDIQINGFWRSEGVGLGDEIGNAFEVNVKDAAHPQNAEAVAEELDGRMPNYFGVQRFGDRGNNAKVGAAILRGDFEVAVMEYLTGVGNERNEEVRAARKRLMDTMDLREALAQFPRYLKGERTVLAYLTKYPKNYANSLKLLPRGIALMFIHAVQARIFNEELEQRIRNEDFKTALYAGSDFYGFPDPGKRSSGLDFPLAPLIGYETKEEAISEYAKEALQSLQLTCENFRSKSMPELAMKGVYRPLLVPIKDLSCSAGSGDFLLAFSLPKGAYATVLLDEFIKEKSNV